MTASQRHELARRRAAARCGGGCVVERKWNVRTVREGEGMLTRPLLNLILRDDNLVRGLTDPEARVLIEWLVERAEEATWEDNEESSERMVRRICRRGRAIARFVWLWCHELDRGAAIQFAAVERFPWPLPTRSVDPCILMQDILAWEDEAAPDRAA